MLLANLCTEVTSLSLEFLKKIIATIPQAITDKSHGFCNKLNLFSVAPINLQHVDVNILRKKVVVSDTLKKKNQVSFNKICTGRNNPIQRIFFLQEYIDSTSLYFQFLAYWWVLAVKL